MPGPEDDADLGDRSRVAALHRTDVPATSDRLPALRRLLTSWAQATGMAGEQIEAMVLAADEAMCNAVSHAYGQDTHGTFDLHATHHPEQHTVRVTVRDRGRWRTAVRGTGRLHGRGLILIRALATETVIEPSATGTTVRMAWLMA
jgi:anti-sigma regulatory factor (Ser/Thr protein kinase)